MTTTKRIAVIGGGITGLSAAYEILRYVDSNFMPLELVLFDSSDSLGGVIKTVTIDGFLMELGPDSIVTIKPWALELCKELGIEGELIDTIEANRKSYIVYNGRLVPVPKGIFLLSPTSVGVLIKSPIFSVGGKLRMAMEPFIPRRQDDRDESLASFIKRRLGSEALDRLAQPIASAIYMSDPRELSMRAAFPQFYDMERSEGSLIKALSKRIGREGVQGPRYGLFKSFRHGIQTLTKALVARLPAGCLVNSTVSSLRLDSAMRQWEVISNDRVFKVDAVCVCTPAFVSGKLLAGVSERLSSLLSGIRYTNAIIANVAYETDAVGHPLDGMGMVAPLKENMSFVACTFCSSKFAERAPPGMVLLRTFSGGDLQPWQDNLDDDEVSRLLTRDVGRLLMAKKPPLWARVTRIRNAMPQYSVGHLDRIFEIRNIVSGIAGLEVAGSALEGVGIPDCINSGRRAAKSLLSYLETIHPHVIEA